MTHMDECRCQEPSPAADQRGCDRRDFLKAAAAISTTLAATQVAVQRAGAESAAAKSALPQFHIGKHSFSRLIVGSNPFNAGSHLSVFVNREMRSLLYARANPQDAPPLRGGRHQHLAVELRGTWTSTAVTSTPAARCSS